MAAGADHNVVGLSSLAAGGAGNAGGGVSGLSSANIAASRALISATLIDRAPARVDDDLWSGVTHDGRFLPSSLINRVAPCAMGRITGGHAVTPREGRETVADRYTLTREHVPVAEPRERRRTGDTVGRSASHQPILPTPTLRSSEHPVIH